MINMHAFVQMPQCETRYGRIDPDAKWTFRIPLCHEQIFPTTDPHIFSFILPLELCCNRKEEKKKIRQNGINQLIVSQ